MSTFLSILQTPRKEMSNGAHRCIITIYQNGAKSDMADALECSEWRANTGGYGPLKPCGWVMFLHSKSPGTPDPTIPR
jgi:hypothetical protein